MIRARRAGFTLVEILIAISILSVVMGSAVVATRAGQQTFQRNLSNGVVDSRACRAINRLARELHGAGINTIFPVRRAPDSTESISVQEISGWDGSQSTWSNAFELRLEYANGEVDNGLDDDGDGFVDECRIVLVENVGTPEERTVVLTNQVAEFLQGELPNGIDDNGNGLEDERGLCFVLDGEELVIRLTVMGNDPDGGLILRTLETSVSVRN